MRSWFLPSIVSSLAPLRLSRRRSRRVPVVLPLAAAAALALLALLALAPPAAAAPTCYGGSVIWSAGGSEIGCVFSTANWGPYGGQSQCSGKTILSPGPRGTCYVCISSSLVSDVYDVQPFLVGSTFSGAQERVLHCVESPEFTSADWSTCVDTYALGDRASWTMGRRSDAIVEDWNWGNDGTLTNGADRGFGWVDCSVELDGVDDYVEVPDSSSVDFGTGDFTVEGWIRTTASSGVRVVLDKRHNSPYQGWHVFLYNGSVALQLADPSGYTNYTSAGYVADGNWRHFAITVDRTSGVGLRFYVDGSLVTVKNPTGRSGDLDNHRPLRMGTRSFSVTGSWQGAIDELSLYHRALSASEIASLADPSRKKCR